MGLLIAKKLYKRNIKVNYLYTFIMCISLTQGFWLIYLASKGMSLLQLGILEGVFHVTSFIMEAPTGAVADLYGRKFSRMLGRLFLIGDILLVFFGTCFTHYLLAFVLCAIGYNLESGSGDALVYDSLLENSEEDRYMKVNGWNEVLYQIAQALGLIFGGWIAVQSYKTLYVGQIGIVLLSLSVALFFTETTIGREEKQVLKIRQRIKAQFVDSFSIVKGNRRLVYLILLLNGMTVFTVVIFYYMQIYCKENGVDEQAFGWIAAISCGFGALGGFSANRIERRFKERLLLLCLPIAFMFISWGMVSFRTAVISFICIGFFDSLTYVIYFDYINRLIPSDKRATLLSVSSMAFSFYMLWVFPLVGAIGESFGLETAFTVVAIGATCLVLINFWLLRPKRA
ncbi:MAG: MFS transporter [Clostridiales bacterium]|nr:MFS transporter [Clostridiales bacterium]